MAKCGINLYDEKKEESPKVESLSDDHNLVNIIAFSSISREMCSLNTAEGLFKQDENGNELDRRKKILYSTPKIGNLQSYQSLCLITGKLPKFTTVGSGCRVSVRDGKWVLTCAHNVTGWSAFQERWVNFPSLRMYNMRQGEKTWYMCRLLNQTINFHPKYNGHPDCGYDIAICQQMEVNSMLVNCSSFKVDVTKKDVIFKGCDPSILEKGIAVEVAGYPGEKRGHPYTHTGKIVKVSKTDLGGYIVWYDVDCTMGNSGSPIMITDKNWLNKHISKDSVRKVIIGVHTGQNVMDELNYGTLITPSVLSWILGKKTKMKSGNEDIVTRLIRRRSKRLIRGIRTNSL